MDTEEDEDLCGAFFPAMMAIGALGLFLSVASAWIWTVLTSIF